MELVYLNSARNCFRYIIKAFGIKEIYIPYYLCSCMRHVAFAEDCKINFYHINLDFSPACTFPKNVYILYPNYFGVCSKIVKKLAKIYPNLIVDNAHSFYAEQSGIASFNSLRKFFPGIRDGALLYINKTASLGIDKDEYIYVPKTLNYSEICQNERRIDNLDMKFMSDTTYKLFKALDLDLEKAKRKSVFQSLGKIYNDTNCLDFTINAEDVPFCYPYLAKSEEDADKLVEKLKNNGITIYRYWDRIPDSYLESQFYKRLVAIPIDC